MELAADAVNATRANSTGALGHVFSAGLPFLRSAGFQTCRIADFQIGSLHSRPAGLETCAPQTLCRGVQKLICGFL
jgi:hypothetical protein